MDLRAVINLVCGILASCCVLFGIIVRMGLLSQVVPEKGMVPIVLGGIIAIFSFWGLRKAKR